MIYEVSGKRNELGAQTATWSGMATSEKALVRTVSFSKGGSTITKTINVYDRPIQLAFGPRGRNFWVYPNGRVEAANQPSKE